MLLEQNVEVRLKTLFFERQKSWEVLKLIHVALLPESISQIDLRVKFLCKFELCIKILEQDLDLVNSEGIEISLNDLVDALGKHQLDGRLCVGLLEFWLHILSTLLDSSLVDHISNI